METAIESRSGSMFDEMLPSMQAHFDAVIAKNGPYLFTVQTDEDLYELYLNNLPDERQHHTCRCCQRFIENYGNLVSINEDGTLESAIWTEDTYPFYAVAFELLSKAVKRGKVTGVALSKDRVWGTPLTGEWTHFHLSQPATMLHKQPLLTPGQAMAAKREDYRTLIHGLTEFTQEVVKQAATLLEAESLSRSEKFLGPVKFLFDLHSKRDGLKGRARDNVTWRAVAAAPVGFCQPRSTMIGTLLEDIISGYDFTELKRRFNAKVNPINYQRPVAPPKAGNIAQAEKIVAELGLEPALHRRYARLDEIQTIWTPKEVAEKPAAGGVFGHLQAYGQTPTRPIDMPAQSITWEKFARTILPNALKIEIYMETRMNFCGVLTATNADAPPIFQWDTPEQRNPFSWYVYHGMSPPSRWGLQPYTWAKVTAVTLKPPMWFDHPSGRNYKGALFVVAGAQDTQPHGLALFPECLKAELHQVRSVIEAYSDRGAPTGMLEASANGVSVGTADSPNKIRVTTVLGTAVYHIDRWD